MRTIKIEEKEYRLRGRFGTISKLLQKYDILKLRDGLWGDADEIYAFFLLESTWKLIQPNKYFKPYIFFWRFKKKIDYLELMEGKENVLSILYGLSEEKQEDLLNSSNETEIITEEKKRIK